jgi:hypothetical protein
MNRRAWRAFTAARDQYRDFAGVLERQLPELRALQQELVNRRQGPAYTVETPVVYNQALEDVKSGDDIRLILVADNPGRREQAAENRRYLVGPSGKIAEKFFRDNPALDIDFRRQVIILNKTPIHTPRTAELRELARLSGGESAVASGIVESQRVMARLIREFHRALSLDKTPAGFVPVWIIGYSEMKKGGIFEAFTETLRELYAPPVIPGSAPPTKTPAKGRDREGRENGDRPTEPPGDWLFLFRHFSMNQFTIDLRQKAAAEEPVAEALTRIGAAYRERILGW